MKQQVIDIHSLIGILMGKSEKIFFIGDALEKFGGNLKADLAQQFAVPPPGLLIPSASSVAEVAKIKIQKNITMDIVPIYMRKSQAEVQYEKRMKGRE